MTSQTEIARQYFFGKRWKPRICTAELFDFKSWYLENENEFFKNAFETVFRASKSRDRGQLVSAFPLTFKQANFYKHDYQKFDKESFQDDFSLQNWANIEKADLDASQKYDDFLWRVKKKLAKRNWNWIWNHGLLTKLSKWCIIEIGFFLNGIMMD